MNCIKTHKLDFALLAVALGVMLFFNIFSREKDKQSGFRLITSTTPAMIQEMEHAIRNGKLIAVTAWRPHWMNTSLKMRYLSDPEKVFGEDENICTIARKGFSEEHPQIARFFRQFQWTLADLESLTWKSTLRKGEYEANAREWIAENPALAEKFLDGVLPVPGTQIKIVNNGFLNELTAGHMVKVLLEERLKCKVTLTTTTLPVAFESLSGGTQDISISVWLPSYHAREFAAISGRVEQLGVNLRGAMLGIAVPDYAPVNSIGELKKYTEEFNGVVVGIEPGQGINRLAEEAIKRYGLQNE